MGSACSADQEEQFEEKVEDVKEKEGEIEEQLNQSVAVATETAADIMSAVESPVFRRTEENAKYEAGDLAWLPLMPRTKRAHLTPGMRSTLRAWTQMSEDSPSATRPLPMNVAVILSSFDSLAALRASADSAEGEAVSPVRVSPQSATMTIEFDKGKGSTKFVDFCKHRALGFTLARSNGGGCCTSVPKPKVVVSKVDKGQQAHRLGVKRGWEIKYIDDVHVTGLEEANKLLENIMAKYAAA